MLGESESIIIYFVFSRFVEYIESLRILPVRPTNLAVAFLPPDIFEVKAWLNLANSFCRASSSFLLPPFWTLIVFWSPSLSNLLAYPIYIIVWNPVCVDVDNPQILNSELNMLFLQPRWGYPSHTIILSITSFVLSGPNKVDSLQHSSMFLSWFCILYSNPDPFCNPFGPSSSHNSLDEPVNSSFHFNSIG